MKLDVSDLIEKGLVIKKTYTEGKYKGLSVLKYHRKVFYNNLWHIDERLLECRGTVVDEAWNVIVLPFRKVFNFGENGTTVDPEQVVICPRKVNGYMLSVTYNKAYGYIVSTTGSLDSEYVKLGEEWLETINKDALYEEGVTHIFEVCDKRDPHIVEENEGIYLIGRRYHDTGKMSSEYFLNGLSKAAECRRGELWVGKFKDLPTDVNHEGYMVKDYFTEEVLCKLKSPHYLSKKAIMRLGKAKVDILFDKPDLFKQRIDEEFYEFVDYLAENVDKEVWRSYNDQQRREFIERYYYGE
jgi:hypothetical protein